MLKKIKNTLGEVDNVFLMTVLMLTVYGLIMVFSASSPNSFYSSGDGMEYLKSQSLWAVIGVFAMLFTASVDYKIIKKMRFLIYGASVFLLLLVAVVGTSVKGAKRWLRLGPFSMQPSEMAKIAIIIMCAYILSNIKDSHWRKTWQYLASCVLVFALCGLFLIFQPHFSAIIIIVGAIGVMMLVSGVSMRIFAGTGIVAGIVGAVLAFAEPYRVERMMSFRNPFLDKSDTGYQAVQSLYAIGSGGFAGLGLGRSRQKYLYIPEPQNDFIFSIICEELGFLGAMLVVVLFIVLLWRATVIALNAPDRYSMILVFGLIALIIIQVILNIGVTTSSIPPTGIPLPFFSAGGSSFVFQMVAMGMILNISSQPKVIVE